MKFGFSAFRVWRAAFLLLAVSHPVVGQQNVGQIREITGRDGKSYNERERVSSVTVIPASSRQPEAGFVTMPLAFGDEILIQIRGQQPVVDRLRIRFDEVRRRDITLGAPSHIFLKDNLTTEALGPLKAWFFGLINLRSRYIQAVAKGTQFGIELDGEHGRLFVWEGEVETALPSQPSLSFLVREKMLTEIDAGGKLIPPRVPRFEEIRDLALFGVDPDPVIRFRFRDQRSQRQLQEDLLRSEFESRTQPHALGPQVRLGNLCLYLGRTREALDHFRAAERISTRSADVYNGLGVGLAMEGAYAQAESQLSIAGQRGATAPVFNNLGVVQLSMRKPVEARASFERAIDLDPRDEAAYNGLSIALTSEPAADPSRLALAREAAETSLQLRDRSLARHTLANVQLAQGSGAEAEANYRAAAQDETVAAAALNNLGVAHLRAADADQAVNEFLEAIRREPSDDTAYCNLGLVYRLHPAVRAPIVERLHRMAKAGGAPFDRILPAYEEFLRDATTLDAASWDGRCEDLRAEIRLRTRN
ncbi:MAG: tetratricopeptide repeat protein [Acidobacteria bacterium]|nr:tetratricopeptide repeat protein [Acidobacteriota bacterium]